MASKNSITFDLLARDVSVTKTMSKLEKGTKSFRTGLAKLAGAVGLAFLGREILDFGRSSVKAYGDAEEAQKKLAFAFEKFPALADSSQKKLQELNSTLQKTTKYDDDAIAAGQALLAQFKLTGKQLEEVTPLLLDYASRTGKDIPAAALDVGKALLGNARALKNVGISYKMTGDTATDYSNITALLREQVGGFAEKEATTTAGKLQILQNQFGEVQEKVGEALTPALGELIDFTSEAVLPGLQDFSDWFAETGLPAVKDFLGKIGEYKDILGPAAIALGALTAAQWLLNIAMAANPVGAVIFVIGVLIAELALLITYWDEITVASANAWIKISAGASRMAANVLGSFEGIVNGAVDMINGLLKVVNQVRKFLGLEEFALVGKVDFDSALTAQADRLDGTSVAVSGPNTGGKSIPPYALTGGGWVPTGLANGGIVSSEIIARIGEGYEPEIVAPLSKLPQVAAAAGLGGTGQFVIEIHTKDEALAGFIDVRIRDADAFNYRIAKMGKKK